jgi:hypothetical protein
MPEERKENLTYPCVCVLCVVRSVCIACQCHTSHTGCTCTISSLEIWKTLTAHGVQCTALVQKTILKTRIQPSIGVVQPSNVHCLPSPSRVRLSGAVHSSKSTVSGPISTVATATSASVSAMASLHFQTLSAGCEHTMIVFGCSSG